MGLKYFSIFINFEFLKFCILFFNINLNYKKTEKKVKD